MWRTRSRAAILMLAAQADLSLHEHFPQVMASIADYVAHRHCRRNGVPTRRWPGERYSPDTEGADHRRRADTAVGFFDTSGNWSTHRAVMTRRISASLDRGHHDDLQAGIRTSRYISKPFKNRITGAFNIAIAQPVKNVQARRSAI